MRKFTTLASLLLAGFVLTACSSDKSNEFEGIPAQELYSKGQEYLESGDYNNAIRHLDAVDIRAMNGAYGEQILLSTIYAQYKLGDYNKALDVAERFSRTYPNSASMDYAFYLAALSNARLGDNFIQDFFGVNRSSRAVENIQNAYGSFQTIVQHFPQSQYVQDSLNWMAYLKNRLAEHELKIAQFYMKRDAYVAVVNRVEDMLRIHPETKATADALPLMQTAFEKLGIQDSAQQVAAMIEANKDKEYPGVTKPEYSPQF